MQGGSAGEEAAAARARDLQPTGESTRRDLGAQVQTSFDGMNPQQKREAQGIQESIDRRMADKRLLQMLSEDGFKGPRYDTTRLRLPPVASPTNHRLLQTGHRFFGRRYGRPSRKAVANSRLLRHHSSRSCFHLHAFVRQAAEQYRRDFRQPWGSGLPHWLQLWTLFLATAPGSPWTILATRNAREPFARLDFVSPQVRAPLGARSDETGQSA
ncbi:hypothetical protein ACFXKC_55725 [Streptomyces sp. NPDC059340]|uniref:hypothetical protein n=1 Tax=Streptomyces sp. NPDC059340 TaxID=3346806 RepID=UPI0036AA42F3